MGETADHGSRKIEGNGGCSIPLGDLYPAAMPGALERPLDQLANHFPQ